MKKALYLMFAVSAATFFACGDSSSSDNGAGAGTYTESYSGSIEVDAENKTVTQVLQQSQSLCVKDNIDLSYSWKTLDFKADTSAFKYGFVGDTLVIYDEDYYGDGFDTMGAMYVGGSNGKLDGTWKSTLCSYDSEKKKTTCYEFCTEDEESEAGTVDITEEELESMTEEDIMRLAMSMAEPACIDEEDAWDYPDVTLKISGNSISATATYKTDEDYSFDDYTNSKFMTSLISELMSRDGDVPSMSKLFKQDSSNMKKLAKDYKKYSVEITNQTKKSITIKIGEESVTVNFKTVSHSDDFAKLAFDVSGNKTTCPYSGEYGVVTKSDCKEANGEYFHMYDVTDADGIKHSVAGDYSKDNERGFSQCVEEMMDSLFTKLTPSKNSSGNDACDSYKEAYTQCVAAMGGEDYCESYLYYYESCVEGGEYSHYGYEDDDAEAEDSGVLFKKAKAKAVKASMEEFVKRARKLANKLQKMSK